MSKSMKLLAEFVREEDAPTTMEYGLLAFFVAIVAISAVTLLGSNTVSLFTVPF